MHFVEKYYWVLDHPKLNGAKDRRSRKVCPQPSIEIGPQLVNPLTDEIDLKDDSLNTKVAFWAELIAHFPWEEDYASHKSASHAWEMDCGGDTYEDAVNALYEKVLKEYGNYTK